MRANWTAVRAFWFGGAHPSRFQIQIRAHFLSLFSCLNPCVHNSWDYDDQLNIVIVVLDLVDELSFLTQTVISIGSGKGRPHMYTSLCTSPLKYKRVIHTVSTDQLWYYEV
jgi:hypothetical protein